MAILAAFAATTVGLASSAAATATSSSPLAWSAPTPVDYLPTVRPSYMQSQAGADLSSVSCPTASLCVAFQPEDARMYTTADPADASPIWTAASVGVPGSAGISPALSCPSASLCVGIDSHGNLLTSTDPAGGKAAWTVTGLSGFVQVGGGVVSCTDTPSVLCVIADGYGNVLSSTNPTGGAASWQIISAGMYLSSLDCPSASLCVGGDSNGDIYVSTDPTGNQYAWAKTQIDTNGITGVSCPSTSLCVAVDSSGDVLTSAQPAGSWTSQAVDTSNGTGVPLVGVSCSSTTMCAAFDQSNQIVSSTDPTGTWSVSTSVDPSSNRMESLSCAPSPAQLCVATDNLGYTITATTAPTSGSSGWTTRFSAVIGLIDGLSCTTASLCVAVDQTGDVITSSDPLGGPSTWTAVTADSIYDSDVLTGVSCATQPSLMCVAVDTAGNVIGSSNPTGGSGAWASEQGVDTVAGFESVSCPPDPTKTLCVAVDTDGQVFTSLSPLSAASWTGAQIDATGQTIRGVSCTSDTLCVAVDQSGNVLTSTNPTGGTAAWTKTLVDQNLYLRNISCAATPSLLCAATDSSGALLSSTNPTGGASAWTSFGVDNATWGTSSISCPTSTYCALIDTAGNVVASTSPTSSSSWSIVSTDPYGGLGSSPANAISCPSSSRCVVTDLHGDVIVGDASGTPVNSAPPTVTGTPEADFTLTEQHGTWTNTPDNYTYQWDDCDSTGANCIAAPNAGSSQTYTLQASDVGHTIRVEETASHEGGVSAAAISNPTPVVTLPPVPANVTHPTVDGAPLEGWVLSDEHGSWTNNPTGYQYQWEDCDSTGANCSPVGGATGRSYQLGSGDVGRRVVVEEWGTNSGGTAVSPAASPATATVVSGSATTTWTQPHVVAGASAGYITNGPPATGVDPAGPVTIMAGGCSPFSSGNPAGCWPSPSYSGDLVQTYSGGSWQPQQELPGSSIYSALSTGADGDSVAAWTVCPSTCGEWVSRRPAGSTTWTPAVELDDANSPPTDTYSPQVTVDQNGNAWVAWQSDNQVNARYFAANGAVGPVQYVYQADLEQGYLQSFSLAADPAGHAVLAIGLSDSAVLASTVSNGTWGLPSAVYTPPPSSYSSSSVGPFAAIGPNGQATVGWFYNSNGSGPNGMFTRSQGSGGTWSAAQQVPSSSDDVLATPSITRDGAGDLRLAWTSNGDPNAGGDYNTDFERVASLNAGSTTWSTQTLAAWSAGIAGSSAVAMDRYGDTVVAFPSPYDTPGASPSEVVRAATAPAGQPFGPPVVLDTAFGGGQGISAVMDDSGNATVDWASADSNADPVVFAVTTTAPITSGAHSLSATMTAPVPTTTLATTFTVGWKGSDTTGSSISYFSVRYRKAAWNKPLPTTYSMWMARTTDTSLLFAGSAGNLYCFSVQAHDAAGNVSPWSSDKCTALPLDDRSMSAAGMWTRGTSSSFYLGTYTSTTIRGGYLSIAGALGGRVVLVATKCPTCGTLEVYYGSNAVASVSLLSTMTVNKALIDLPPFSSGTIKLVVTSSNRNVLVDGMVISRV